MGSKDRPQPIWDSGSINVPKDILVPLVDHEEAPTISLSQLRDPLLTVITTLEYLEHTDEKMTRQTRYQTREPFKKGSRHQPRAGVKSIDRMPVIVDGPVQPDIETDENDDSNPNGLEDIGKLNVCIPAQDVLNISEIVRLSHLDLDDVDVDQDIMDCLSEDMSRGLSTERGTITPYLVMEDRILSLSTPFAPKTIIEEDYSEESRP